jgi:Fic family protein
MEQIVLAAELKASLDALRPIDGERESIIMQKLRLDWDYHSNHLEGNSLTYGETKALIMFGITAQGKPLKDHFEITGHDEAIKWIIEIVKEEYPLNESFIRQLHTLLLKQSYEVDAITPDGKPTKKRIEIGKYKSIPNHVVTKTGEIFRFATPEETPAMMHKLMEWYKEKKKDSDINPIILAAEFHYKFIRIHPFDDGNGRIARILMNFILMQFGYPPAIIKTEDKRNYFAALQQADSGLYEPFFTYIAGSVVRSLEIMIAGAKGERIEEPDDLDKQLALLEQRIKGLANKELTRSKETLLAIYDDTVARLSRLLVHNSDKFERFYEQMRFMISVDANESSAGSFKAFTEMRDFITGDTQNIILAYVFKLIKYPDMGDFSFHYEVTCTFKSRAYYVEFNNHIIEQAYGIQLTDQELSGVVHLLVKRHMDFLTEKLKNAQGGNT